MKSPIPKKSEACIGVDVIPMLKQLNVVGDVSEQDVALALHEIIATGNYSIKPRFKLEASTTELHFIPYIQVVSEDGASRMAYQRPARDDGEKRLDGKFSIGLGGHPESKAFTFPADILDLSSSLINAAVDEFTQEIRVEQPCEPKPETDGWDSRDITNDVCASIKPIGFIYDPSDDVGLTHVAVLFEVVAPNDAFFKANSPTEVRNPEWRDTLDIIRETNDGLENWSRLWIKHQNRQSRRALPPATGG